MLHEIAAFVKGREGITQRAKRVRGFFEWVNNTWYDPGDNIYVWDFYELETEGGLFFPSGTQANVAAVQIQSGPGTEVIVEEGCHIFMYEAGGAAMLTGAQLRPLRGVRGALARDQVEAAIRFWQKRAAVREKRV